MTADDKSDGSGSSEGSASSQGTIEKICAKENNVRARVGLYMKDGEKLRADFHALYRALPDLRKKKDRRKLRRKTKSNKHHKDKKKKLVDDQCKVVARSIHYYWHTLELIMTSKNKNEDFDDCIRNVNNEAFRHLVQGGNLNTLQETKQERKPFPGPGKGRKYSVDSWLVMQGMMKSPSSRRASCIPSIFLPRISSTVSNPPTSSRGRRHSHAGISSTPSVVNQSMAGPPVPPKHRRRSMISLAGSDMMAAHQAVGHMELRTMFSSQGELQEVDESNDSGQATPVLPPLEGRPFFDAGSLMQEVPVILTYLQRSVHAVLLGKTSRPDWLLCGVPKAALIDRFTVKIMTDGEESKEDSTMTCDGHYLFVHNAHGLFKIGSGFGGTMKGHVYIHRPDFYPRQRGWLGFAHGDVFYRPEGSSGELVVIDREVLKVAEVYQCSAPGWSRGLPFSDGINIGHISPDREDGFVVRTYNPLVKPMPLVNELNLSLAIRCIQTLGGSEPPASLSTGLDEDILTVASGKDFTLVRTVGGKVSPLQAVCLLHCTHFIIPALFLYLYIYRQPRLMIGLPS
ncbi:E3 ubiquitin-protein ligase MYCBP2 [Portunus trituberculatus]|uniref:E3 ubiquitin-protein ligase MYCBP2 n=1 Tax=Portunus trituberculatus TaxID=210409 RepID=A0A5B7F8F3_PORTR|nr:E3 ubiquitin-protein ligase MYCBP2 [Portunus trituberculatus]